MTDQRDENSSVAYFHRAAIAGQRQAHLQRVRVPPQLIDLFFFLICR